MGDHGNKKVSKANVTNKSSPVDPKKATAARNREPEGHVPHKVPRANVGSESGGSDATKGNIGLIICFEIVIFLSGLMMIIAGAVVQAKFGGYYLFFGGKATPAAAFLWADGLFVFFLGIFGICVVAMKNKCMTSTFTVFLVTAITLQIAATIVVFALQNKITKVVENDMKAAIVNYNLEDHHDSTATWDKVQKELRCCGAKSYRDWNDNVALKGTGSVPDSCCSRANTTDGCGQGQLLSPSIIRTEGCKGTFVDWTLYHLGVVGGIAAGVSLIEIIWLLYTISYNPIRK